MALKPGPKGPHTGQRVVTGSIREKAWRAMQIKGKFSLGDLCRAVLTGEETGGDPKSSINRYVTALCAVGVLAELRMRVPPTSAKSRGEKRWLLMRDLGRKAPTLRRSGDIYDPNAEQLLPRRREETARAQ